MPKARHIVISTSRDPKMPEKLKAISEYKGVSMSAFIQATVNRAYKKLPKEAKNAR